jgi:CubicO group peptidase (beta-lactamase class C family)
LGGIAGHAGLFGTAADLCRLGNLYLGQGGSLLRHSTVAASLSVQVEAEAAGIPLTQSVPQLASVLTLTGEIRSGLGWMLYGVPEYSCSTAFSPRSFGHMGYTGTSLWCDPDRDLVVTLLTNRIYHGRNPEAIDQLRPAVHAEVVAGLNSR